MTDDFRLLDDEPESVTLSNGTVVLIEHLRARQFFKLLRIVTRGALPNMQDMSLFKVGNDMDPGEFAGRFLSLMLLSIPEAEDEAIDFVNSMVKPYGLIERPSGLKLNKQDLDRNTELWTQVITTLDNPELDDLVTIIEAIVRRESADIQALGKRLGAMFKMAEKTGQVPKPETTTAIPKVVTVESPTLSAPSLNQASPVESYSVPSAAPGTSSPASTAGPTSTSQTYVSDESARLSPPSLSASSISAGSASSG